MKQTEMIVLALAGLAVWMIVQSKNKSAGATGTGTRSTVDNFVDEIFNAKGTPFENGWRYYENGVAIDPQGNYYQDGKKVWSAPSAGASGGW